MSVCKHIVQGSIIQILYNLSFHVCLLSPIHSSLSCIIPLFIGIHCFSSSPLHHALLKLLHFRHSSPLSSLSFSLGLSLFRGAKHRFSKMNRVPQTLLELLSFPSFGRSLLRNRCATPVPQHHHHRQRHRLLQHPALMCNSSRRLQQWPLQQLPLLLHLYHQWLLHKWPFNRCRPRLVWH